MSSIGTNCIFKRDRPDLSEVKTSDLEQILLTHDYEWINPERTRVEMIHRIFELWSEKEILDQTNKPIICAICTDTLTNGDNMTYTCGHQMHSGCMSRYIIINCVEKFSSGMKNNDVKELEFDYKCPNCRVIFGSYVFKKEELDTLEFDEQ